jgi:hypothetical protein
MFFYDEDTLALLSTTTFQLTIQYNSSVSNYTITNGRFNTTTDVGIYIITYGNGSYPVRTGVFTVNSSFMITNASFYLVAGSNVLAYVYDKYGIGQEGYLLKTMRLLGGSYQLVDSSYTNSEGLTGFVGKYNTPYYYWIIEKDGIVVKTTEITQIFTSPLHFFITSGESINEGYQNVGSLSHTLTYDNTTNNFILNYADGSSTLTNISLTVHNGNNISYMLINSSSVYNGILIIDMDGNYVNGTTYIAKVSVKYNTGWSVIDSLSHYYPTFVRSSAFKTIGLFLVFIIVVLFASLGAYFGNISIAFIMVGFSLFITFLLELTLIAQTGIVLLIAGCFIGAWLTRIR